MVARKIAYFLLLSSLVALLNSSRLISSAAEGEKQPENTQSKTELAATETSANGTGYTLAAQEGDLALYVDMKTGQFYIRDSSSDMTWYSVPQNLNEASGMKASVKNRVRSILTLEILDVDMNNDSMTIYSHGDSVYYEAVEAALLDGGVRIDYTFPDYSITVPLTLMLTEEGFCASVDVGEVVEDDNRYRLVAVSILPYFNAGYFEEEGYMLVPDGSGAIINFDNGKSSMAQYSQKVYGLDYGLSLNFYNSVEQNVRLPVYGIAHSNQFSLAIITQGAAGADIMAFTNTATNKYNYVYSRFPLRLKDYFQNEGKWSDVSVYQKAALPDRTLEIQYYIRSAPSPTYTDLALVYREYITDKLGLKPKAQPSAMEVNFIGATIKKKLFLGIPIYGIASLTSFTQAQEILDTLKEADINNVTIRYKNWSDATAWGKMKASAGGLSKLGGKKALKSLMSTASEYGYSLYLDVNPVEVYKGKSILSGFTDYSHSIFNDSIRTYSYTLNTYEQKSGKRAGYLVRNDLIINQFTQWDKAVAKLGATGISLSGTDTLYTDFRKSDACEEDTLNSMLDALQKVTENKKIMIDSANIYTLSKADYLSGIPGSASSFDIEDESVPFYQIALHGLIPYSVEPINAQGNYTDAYLHTVEVGAVPRFEWIAARADTLEYSDHSALYYANYAAWLPTAIDMVRQCAALHEKTANAAIIKHTIIADGVYLTEYDNGVFTIVNYNKETIRTDYASVGAKSFIVGEKK